MATNRVRMAKLNIHVLLKLVQVVLLVRQPLLQLEKLLLLALADSIVLASLLAALESISVHINCQPSNPPIVPQTG